MSLPHREFLFSSSSILIDRHIFCSKFLDTNYRDTGAVWVLAQNGLVPPNAVISGHENDGTMLYVGRAYTKEGQLAPGKVVPSHGCLYHGCGGTEQAARVYQVLTHPNQNEGLKWVPTTDGNLPTGALRAGGESIRNGLYIARATFNGSLCGGKFEPAHGCAYVPWGGKEHSVKQCEVLCVTAVDF